MELVTNTWRLLTSHRMQVVALLVILSMLAPHPAEAQFGLVVLARHHHQRDEHA